MPEPRDQQERPEDAMHEAAEVVAQTGGNIVYALMAFFATSIIAQNMFGMDHDASLEVSMLNAGLAYYSHAATGRVVRACAVLIKDRKKVRVHDVTQKVEVKD